MHVRDNPGPNFTLQQLPIFHASPTNRSQPEQAMERTTEAQ